MSDYLLFCRYCSSYTMLYGYDKEASTFLGEYSLLYNEYTRNSTVLNKFLLAHLGHSLRSIPSKTDEYMNVICTASHFLEDDIDKYVEDSLSRRRFQETSKQHEREIGRVQIHIIEHLLNHELSLLRNTRSSSAAEAQVLLGKELGITKALEVIQQVLNNKQLAP